MKATQTELIKAHLESGKSITPLDALYMFGCFRLGARIFELKKMGVNIAKRMVEKEGKRYAQYQII